MKAYALLQWTANPKTNVFHYVMFHGESGKEECEAPDWFAHSLDDDLTDPLYIIRNGWRIPDIFSPSHCNLVISERVKEQLDGLANLRFCPVKYKKLINMPYRVGDFSFFKSKMFLRNPRKWNPDYDGFFDNFPDDNQLHARIGPYYELVMGSHWEILTDPKYHFTHKGRYDGKPRGYDEDIYEIPLCSEMLEEYPIFSAEEGYLLNEKAAHILRPFLDPDYFVVQKVKITPFSGFVEDFSKYERMRDAGATPDDVFKTAGQDGVDWQTQNRLLRKVFGFSLKEVKEIKDKRR